MFRKNQKGGAAAVAVMVIIMIIAIASAVLVVTGRFAIKKGNTDTPAKTSSSKPDSSSETISESDLSSVAPEPVKPDLYPAESAGYETINIKDLTASSAMLINLDTNEIVAGLNYDKRIYPASLTKILTLMVAVENAPDLKAKYKFTDEDIAYLVEENASVAGFQSGEEVTVEDLLYAAILMSGGDGTLGLAKSVAGSEAEFVKLMNQKLVDLGLDGTTHFTNASGLHDKNLYTTVQDIAVITKAALESETCKKVLTTETYTTSKTKENPDGITLSSIMLSRFNGYFFDCDGNGEEDEDFKLLGGKTGFTDEAQYTLVTIFEKGGNTYLCVTAKSESDFASVEDTIAIVEKYLSSGVKRIPASEAEKDESKEDTFADNESGTVKVSQDDTQNVDEAA